MAVTSENRFHAHDLPACEGMDAGSETAMLARSALAPLALLALLAGLASAQPRFHDATAEVGLGMDTGSACWFDADGDGWVDIQTGGGIWRNVEGRTFERIGDCACAVAADYDNDGYTDLFSWASLTLLHNDGGRSFSVVPLPPLPPTSSRGASWGDWNRDGYADLYIGGYEDWNNQITFPDLILTNRGGAAFELTWQEERYRARGVSACDFDRDADLDVYVSDYRLQPNVLWLNDGHGSFRDAAGEYGVIATSEGFDGGHSIGACWGDFDNDGEIDLFAGNFAHVDDRGDQPKSRFLRNLGSGGGYRFQDLGTCGVFYQESYASPACGDYDTDGDLDLWFTTVYLSASFGRANHPVLFRNDGGFTFTDVTAAEGLAELGATYGAAWADFDRDGDLDLVSDGRLWRNGTTGSHWLAVRLEGDGTRVDRSALGAQVRIRTALGTLTREVEAGTGEGNQNDLVLHFGLGAETGPFDLEILWPDGTAQTVPAVPCDTLATVPLR